MQPRGSNKKIANGLVALSSAAILTVYAAGYVRTRSAAARFEVEAAGRRPAGAREPAIAAPAAPSPAPAHVAADPSAAAPPLPASETHVAELRPAPALPAASTPVPAAPERAADPSSEASAPVVEVVAPVAAVEPAATVPAPAPAVEAAQAAQHVDGIQYRDGTYYGWGSSRHGDIQTEVVIEGGRIASATIAQCRTRYPCSVIAKLPPQVAVRQSPNVDYVSGATESADAFYYGLVEALSKAK